MQKSCTRRGKWAGELLLLLWWKDGRSPKCVKRGVIGRGATPTGPSCSIYCWKCNILKAVLQVQLWLDMEICHTTIGIPCVFHLQLSTRRPLKNNYVNKLVPFWPKWQIRYFQGKKTFSWISPKYEIWTLWILDMLLPMLRAFSTCQKIRGAGGGKTTFGLFSKKRPDNKFT